MFYNGKTAIHCMLEHNLDYNDHPHEPGMKLSVKVQSNNSRVKAVTAVSYDD